MEGTTQSCGCVVPAGTSCEHKAERHLHARQMPSTLQQDRCLQCSRDFPARREWCGHRSPDFLHGSSNFFLLSSLFAQPRESSPSFAAFPVHFGFDIHHRPVRRLRPRHSLHFASDPMLGQQPHHLVDCARSAGAAGFDHGFRTCQPPLRLRNPVSSIPTRSSALPSYSQLRILLLVRHWRISRAAMAVFRGRPTRACPAPHHGLDRNLADNIDIPPNISIPSIGRTGSTGSTFPIRRRFVRFR